MKRTMSLAAFAAVALTGTATFAQAPSYVPFVGYGGVGYGHYHHASTAGEGYLNGWANNIRARGEYNYLSSLGMINVEEARSRSIDNKKKWADTYFEMRRMNESYRAANRKRPPTPEQVARYAKMASPDRLQSNELDPLVRTIYWPASLQRPEYEALRVQLDELFAAQNADNSGLGSENYREIRQVADAMVAGLRARFGEMDSAEYMQAKSFLDSLAYEARFAPRNEGVAIR
jgi:hypothetical protein